MSYSSTLLFDTKVDQSGFEESMGALEKIANNTISIIGAAFSKGAISKSIVTIAQQAVSAMVTIGKQAVALSFNLEEVQTVVDATFGEDAGTINAWANNAVNRFGLSELKAKELAGAFGMLFESMGVSGSAIGEMSTGMSGLVGDFASFFNVEQDVAADVLSSAIKGKTESIQQFGVDMSATALEAYALAEGMGATYSEMSQAEQAALRYSYVMQSLSDVQGNYASSAGSYANASHEASLALDEVYAAIGSRLSPAVTSITSEIGDLARSIATGITRSGFAGAVDAITDRFPAAAAAVSGLTAAFATLLIIQTVQSAMKAFAAVQESLNALTVAGSVLKYRTAW